ncbi:MAG: cytochrome c oxidase subunit 3 [Bryobacterales bacterium]|nr:cytochrome c oxidase subunit 3 [Bryobacterales bacterium]
MATTVAPRSGKREDGANGSRNGGDRRGGNGGSGGLPQRPQTHRLGMLLALAGIAMLFIALTSAYVVRQGLGGDWTPMAMPRILLWNTAILLASSFTVEKARRALLARTEGEALRWLLLTLALGVAFLGGQLAAWRTLSARGLFLDTSPHSSFFYVLSGVHGVHVAGGLLALAFPIWSVWSAAPGVASFAGSAGLPAQVRRARWVEAAALYWHFMDGLWIYLLVLLFARS